MAMKQLTIRGIDRAVERRIRAVAKREGVSLNKAALRLLENASAPHAGEPRREKIGHSLDKFIGDWTDEEADAMLESLKVFEVVDDEDWK